MHDLTLKSIWEGVATVKQGRNGPTHVITQIAPAGTSPPLEVQRWEGQRPLRNVIIYIELEIPIKQNP